MKRILISLFFLTIAFGAMSQYLYSGKVISEDGLPIKGVTVQKGQAATLTDSSGIFTLVSDSVLTSLTYTSAGYLNVEINFRGEKVPTVILLSSTVMMEEAVVQSFESKGHLKQIPASVSILNKAALERYNNNSFVSAINTVAGVKMDERSPGSYRLSIRGNLQRSPFGVRNVKMYWNGVPFTDANGNTYLNQVGFINIGKIEILKGPAGSMYGSGTGGVVLLSSALPEEQGRVISVQSSAGSHGLFNLSGSYNHYTANSKGSLSLSHQKAEGYREHTNMKRDVMNYSGSIMVNNHQNVGMNIFFSDLYYQTPGALTQSELTANPLQPRPSSGMFPGATKQKAALYLQTFYVGLSNDYRFNSHLTNFTGVYGSHTRLKNPAIRNYERKTEQGAGLRSVTRYEAGIFNVVFGGEYQYSFNNTATFGNRAGNSDTLQYHDEINSRQYNIFFQPGLKLGNTILSAGASYNNFHYGFLRLNDVGSKKQSSNFTPQFITRVAANQQLNNQLNVYAAFSQGYSPPSIDEVHASDGVFNKQLRAETGLNYEAGIKSRLLKTRLSADVTYYLFNLKNTIVSRRDASGGDFFVNAGKTKQQGLEVAVNYLLFNDQKKVINNMKLWGTYTNIYARFKEYQQGGRIFNGNKLTGTPPHVIVLGVDMNTQSLFFNSTYMYTSSIPLNDANTFFAPHYNLLNARVSYKTEGNKKIGAQFFVFGEHAFNEPYSLGNDLNPAGNRFYNPSPPFTITAGVLLQYKLKMYRDSD
jgi:iron complex outermembrane receptor protein